MIGLGHYLALSAVLFGVGAIGFLTRRNVLIQLISIEIMLNSVNLTLVAFNRRHLGDQCARGEAVRERISRRCSGARWRRSGGRQVPALCSLNVLDAFREVCFDLRATRKWGRRALSAGSARGGRWFRG